MEQLKERRLITLDEIQPLEYSTTPYTVNHYEPKWYKCKQFMPISKDPKSVSRSFISLRLGNTGNRSDKGKAGKVPPVDSISITNTKTKTKIVEEKQQSKDLFSPGPSDSDEEYQIPVARRKAVLLATSPRPFIDSNESKESLDVSIREKVREKKRLRLTVPSEETMSIGEVDSKGSNVRHPPSPQLSDSHCEHTMIESVESIESTESIDSMEMTKIQTEDLGEWVELPRPTESHSENLPPKKKSPMREQPKKISIIVVSPESRAPLPEPVATVVVPLKDRVALQPLRVEDTEKEKENKGSKPIRKSELKALQERNLKLEKEIEQAELRLKELQQIQIQKENERRIESEKQQKKQAELLTKLEFIRKSTLFLLKEEDDD